ncbi:unnamed protein product [Hymenolepis diminuta]|uniref:SET domain-containing protein n=1 Tax=Hymenolepis diminuta TaxID=6216 RepID=A0A0R3SS20_HYMDI|nr:unnamed protein product [Hymenolepis diminuta]VUZ52639.1 unnamed protein product [Hymenolepis diminuta]
MSKSIDLSTRSFELNKPWSFGSHALLSDNDRVYVTRLLECQKCRIRQVYHGVIARELSKRPKNDSWEPIKSRHHFHQLTRLIKAVLIACKLQKNLYRTGGSICSGIPPIRGLPLSRPPRLRRWICQCHATDLFHYILYAAEDDIYDLHLKQVNSSKPAKWPEYIFPKGSSILYEKSLSKFEKTTSVSQFRNSMTCPSFTIPYDEFFQPSSGFGLLMGTSAVRKAVEHKYFTEEELADANRRFNEGYKNLGSVKHVEKEGKCVRFPKFSPVTRIYNLITYETACRYLRRDRCWELCFLARVREGQNDTDEDDDGDDYSCDKFEGKEGKDISAEPPSPSDPKEPVSKKALEENEEEGPIFIYDFGDDRNIVELGEIGSLNPSPVAGECVEERLREEKELEVLECTPDVDDDSQSISSGIVTLQNNNAVIVKKRKGRRRRRRHDVILDNINKLKSSQISVPFHHSLIAPSSSFQGGSAATYIQQISSLLFNNLYSSPPTETSSPSVKLVDEICVSEVSQKS